jgi:site-specific DNA-methyltransferase (adenine-specific)
MKIMQGQHTLFSKTSDEWATPQGLFDRLNEEFGFTLDPAATSKNAKCKKFFTLQNNGLIQSWQGEKVFINPPFSNVKGFMKKAYEEGKTTLVVCLVASRTDTTWFHDFAMKASEIRLIRGRLNYNGGNSATFPSAIVIFDPNNRQSYPILRPFSKK